MRSQSTTPGGGLVGGRPPRVTSRFWDVQARELCAQAFQALPIVVRMELADVMAHELGRAAADAFQEGAEAIILEIAHE